MIIADKMQAGLLSAMCAAPYARHALAAIRLVEEPRLPQVTMACDKYWRVYYHPELDWSAGEIGWVLLHEVLGHLVRGHCAETEADLAHLTPGSPELRAEQARYNVAQDLEIESWEWDQPLERPHGGLTPSAFNLPPNKTWRWYLENLSPSLSQDQDCGSGATGGSRAWEHGEDDAPVVAGSVAERVVQQATARAIKEHAEGRGDAPEGLLIWADTELTPPKVDWRAALRTVVASRIACGATDMIGPARERHGVLLPRWRAEKPRLCVIADTSGSMDSEGGKVLGACVDLLRHSAGELAVCWVDAQPVWQTVRNRNDLRPVGGGGTDLRPAIYAARKGRYDLCVIITDCDTPWPETTKANEIVLATGGKPPSQWRVVHAS